MLALLVKRPFLCSNSPTFPVSSYSVNSFSSSFCTGYVFYELLCFRSFRDRMKNLLGSMLKLDPRERMTFNEFFETVDDIIRSKIEIINLLHGTSFKIIADPALT